MCVKKVLFITSSFPFGKGESFIEPELEFLSKHYILDVLSTYPRGKLKDFKPKVSGDYIDSPLVALKYFISLFCFLARKPATFYSLVKGCLVSSWPQTCRNLILIPKAVFISRSILQKGGYQFIYCHWLSAPAQLSLLLSIITSIPFGITAHRWDIINNNNVDKKLAGAHFLRVISEYSKKLLSERMNEKYGLKIKRLYLGVNRNLSFPKKYVEKKAFTGVCIASLLEVKGHAYLLYAIKNLSEREIDLSFKFVGDGVLKEELTNLASELGIADKVEFCGNLEHRKVIKLLSSEHIDFSCLPSIDLGGGHHEGIPVALMESMAFGLPCISTKTGSISELIESGVNGLLVEDKNAEHLADAIMTVISEPSQYNIFSKNSQKTIIEKFDSDTNNFELCHMINSSQLEVGRKRL